MANHKVKVLYIAGSGRSGSTILDSILNQINGFIGVGEIRSIWDVSFISNWHCGCGKRFSDCEFWQAVIHAAFGHTEYIDPHKMSRLTESLRMQHLPLLRLSAEKQHWKIHLKDCLENLEKLYLAMQEVSGASVIIDSSKNPAYANILAMIPSIDLYVVHLIRDSRAVAYSWSKKKLFEPGRYMAQYKPHKSALQWTARNITAEWFIPIESKKKIQFRYEDFVKQPLPFIEKIAQMVDGHVHHDLSFIHECTVELQKPLHSVFGNESRFQKGTTILQPDNQWKTMMKFTSKWLVAIMTAPLLLKYGYLLGMLEL